MHVYRNDGVELSHAFVVNCSHYPPKLIMTLIEYWMISTRAHCKAESNFCQKLPNHVNTNSKFVYVVDYMSWLQFEGMQNLYLDFLHPYKYEKRK